MIDNTSLSGPIFLIGYMGSGKTTLGRALGRHLGIPFVDLDEAIIEREGASVKEIFARSGESGFRRIERSTLGEVALEWRGRPVIIACGGGTPCHFDNMDVMLRAGVTVFLDASLDALHRRLAMARSERPLIAAMTDEQLRDFISTNLEARRPHYSRARITFCSDRLESPEEIAESINEFLSLL